MKIGIDARFYNESGVGRYLQNLIKKLSVLDSINEYYIFLLAEDLPQFIAGENFQKVKVDFPWYSFAEQFKFPQLLTKFKLDLVHFPHFNVPIFYQGEFVVTIHDLIHQHHQMKRATTLNPFTFKIKQIGYRKVFEHAVIKSCKIIVPSNSVKQLLVGEWNVNSDKIIVTPEAVDEEIITLSQRVKKLGSEQLINKFKIRKQYLFYVGNAHPHKNVEGLIKAFVKLRQKYPSLSLVLSGGDHYFWERIKKEYSLPGITYTGFINDDELVALYKNAAAFILPSFEEGFGLPILEAMACGCPVVASNVASLPEVGGDAAVYFNPQDLDDMANKISKVLENTELREQLIEKGKKRYKEYSWEKLANQTLEVYSKCG